MDSKKPLASLDSVWKRKRREGKREKREKEEKNKKRKEKGVSVEFTVLVLWEPKPWTTRDAAQHIK